jgi:AcrR family transcriptional regulator
LAKGTFFRHFPSKRAILVAILVDSVKRQTVIAQALLDDPTDDLIQTYMTANAADIVPLRGVIETTILNRIDDPAIIAAMGELLHTLDQLLTQAKQRREIRNDITALDVHTLVFSATNSSAHFFFRDQPEIWRRYLSITLDGLRPEAATPLPAHARGAKRRPRR